MRFQQTQKQDRSELSSKNVGTLLGTLCNRAGQVVPVRFGNLPSETVYIGMIRKAIETAYEAALKTSVIREDRTDSVMPNRPPTLSKSDLSLHIPTYE